jgi:hypothetical protein
VPTRTAAPRRLVPLIALALVGPARSAAPQAPPVLAIEAPPALAGARARLEAFDRQRLAAIVGFVGLADPGPLIVVELASETSDWAALVPPWTAGLALGATGRVVLFPARSPVYPLDTLEDVLRHEVAHVLAARAAGGRPIPRWFDEGLAMTAERAWNLEDRGRVAYALALGPRVGLDRLDDLFAGDQRAQSRAYALAGAFARDLLGAYGRGAPAAILRRVATGEPFAGAFARVTGVALVAAEDAFWRRQRLWSVWVPLATSTSALWMVVTVLALYAMRTRRRKSAALRERWEQEESAPASVATSAAGEQPRVGVGPHEP